MPANKGRKLPPELLTPEDIRALLAACSARAPTGVRNRALVATLYRAGLRLDEALTLHPADVDVAAGVIHVGRAGGHAREAGIDAAALAIVKRWLQVRAALGLGADSPLFCTLSGGSIHPAYVRQLLPRLAEKAGIDKRVHAQGLRYTHAAELAAEGMPAELIQAQLGHESLASTDRYLRRMSPEERIDAVQRREWSP
ncbi:MAG TPA: tyrosine-type recombinase/integrase [Acidimicrobiia bacterium]|nr:tyrosine-type recombinase/integrase [Acidimicrobiia bacterium]